jgi:hypothetical protein
MDQMHTRFEHLPALGRRTIRKLDPRYRLVKKMACFERPEMVSPPSGEGWMQVSELDMVKKPAAILPWWYRIAKARKTALFEDEGIDVGTRRGGRRSVCGDHGST